MISSGAYNYINVLEKASDASWTRNSVISNNIANVDTPGYKRKDIRFEEYLQGAVSGGSSLHANPVDVERRLVRTGIRSIQHNLRGSFDKVAFQHFRHKRETT